MRLMIAPLVALAALSACTSSPPPPTPITVGVDGAWSNPATWGGSVPGANSSVTIPAGKTVTVDSGVTARNITVQGTLLWADADNLEVKANWIMVENGGAFRIGSSTKPFTRRATITLTGSDTTENHMGMGTKCVCVMGGGVLEVFGEDRLTWTKLNASANPGASSLTLADAAPWRAGEQVVVTSSTMNPDEAEVHTLKAVNGKAVTLEGALKYAHFGQLQTIEGKTVDERTEVGLLSRNIVIQGDEDSAALKFGGHVMVMNTGSTARIQGVEFKRMGQFNRLGRYPVHYHLLRDAQGSFVRASSIHDSIQRGIVVHGSDNVRVENNVVFNTVGHGYVLEDGSERGATFKNNLGLLAKPATFTVDGLKDQNDQMAATFWLRTAAGTFSGNSAAGGEHAGYWFDMGFVDGNNATKAMLTFQDNTVHSQLSGKQGDANTWAIWHTDGFVPSSEGILKLERVTAFKNERAIETSGRGLVVDSVFSGNGKAISGLLLRDSLVVSRSLNPDTNSEWGATGMFAYGGHARAERVTWVGFKDGRTVSSTLACGIEYPRFTNLGARLVDSSIAAGCGDVIQSDLDGSLSGMGSARQLVNLGGNFGLVTAQCTRLNAQGVAVCPDYDYRTLGVTYPTGPNDRFSNDNWRVDVVRDEDNDRVTPDHFRWISYVVPGKTYRLEVRNIKNTNDTTVYNPSKLAYINLGFNAGERADPAPLEGAKTLAFDPAAAARSLEVSATAFDTGFRVRLCRATQSCPQDSSTWGIVNATASVSALRAGSSTGYTVEPGRLVMKFYGGDQLRLERL